jgi:hypothetical protein
MVFIVLAVAMADVPLLWVLELFLCLSHSDSLTDSSPLSQQAHSAHCLFTYPTYNISAWTSQKTPYVTVAFSWYRRSLLVCKAITVVYVFDLWALSSTGYICYSTASAFSLINEKYLQKFCFGSRITCPDSISVAYFGNKMWPLLFLWDASLVNVFIPTLTVMLIFILAINIIRYLTPDLHIQIRDTSKEHNWHNGKLLSKV